MPIIVNNAAYGVNATPNTSHTSHPSHNTASAPDLTGLYAKRAARNALKTKYTLVHRKDRTTHAYKNTKLIVDGKEVPISDSAKFVLEQMVDTPETTANTSNTG